ncbi:P-loop containing nucleoside triphosphate hydrolase protein [Thozetella sp. PMI_491]|nr:P-loop containing nucleoside triphosphate hydrolase protein [Thozetella sp. PMI_491]
MLSSRPVSTSSTLPELYLPPKPQQADNGLFYDPPEDSAPCQPNIGRYRIPDEIRTTKASKLELKYAEHQPPLDGLKWDFVLPVVALDGDEPDFRYDEGRSRPFSTRRLVSSIQSGLSLGQLQHYLSFFSGAVIRRAINEVVLGYPAIFYAVATNDAKMVRKLAESGADVNSTDTARKIPLVAFAILLGHSGLETTEMVLTLLSLGAEALRIPPVFFSPYLEDVEEALALVHRNDPMFRSANTAWCVEWIRSILAESINITQRYFLERTWKSCGPSERQRQVAQMHGATNLLGISYFLVGQVSAARIVTSRLLSHLALPKSKPLVMVFAGPSGHGKTELARRMGELLSLEIETVDCTEMKHESDLFGPKKPYMGYEKGSPVNNFLARNNGKRSIIFLDEFEKTTSAVQNALLVPFDEGRFVDRRTREPMDCSQTIWVIATNAVDGIILDFCESRKPEIFDTDDTVQHGLLMDELTANMRKQLKSEFGNPLSGRISVVVPFLPFSPGEAAVVAHKYLLELRGRVSQDIRLSGQQLVGNIVLEVRRDGALCKALAEEGYDSDQGARSLKATVEGRITDELVRLYLQEEGRISDSSPRTHYVVDLAENGVISVFKAASRS